MSDLNGRPLAAIILAAGQGTRMRSSLHKVLHPIAGKPMLLHLLDSLDAISEGAEMRKIVVVGKSREQVEPIAHERGADIAVQEEQLGTGHAVLQAEPLLDGFDGDVLACFGDVPMVSGDTVNAMRQALHKADANSAMPAAVVLGFRPEDAKAYGRVIANDDGRIAKMVEYKDATDAEKDVNLCNSGLLMARSADMFSLLSKVGNENASGEYYLPDLVTIALVEGRSCRVIECDHWEVEGVNSRAELAQVEAQWQQRKRAEMMAAGVTLIAPETVFFAHDTAIEPDVTVAPHVVFGPGVRIASGTEIHSFSHIEGADIGANCQIGPYARLRPGAELREKAKVGNFVEMKKAVLGEGAKANHLSYIGDASVGAGANIGAGTITCNYDGFFKYRTEIGKGAFIGSNSALVAPVTIGDGAIVGAGATVTQDVPADALALVRAETKEKTGWAARFRAAMTKKKQ
ncbi:bifunctional UDP-N-acetylglucosamine diphosphorylase/glucosamine-1-phosphate N-acetyltransferase GlmU [Alterisphingorhabdus coralli]|uniref:Bifunctional protein GlmU n=1 Tax=Alterisphingorhabdus coralli TaxID=3071408 RepID=A0AA97F814_9SPHN|nr:bifunctional UDP-N-acetylglucosamine diphosphorylase/glucosamine-1-phosphate N-acetyltransferase GlmU [Parasphingorhabdus sp. SCSIO 66989]WOE74230.1 bifunctional UDP-N-acetylglucosamine diphosphorylase/glucosamine-1-phosphate N-acetyltransferase GlmU [Parasphingorhabdus sp. SCSIO 66989]